eukprot:1136537-Pelagomonas_calceolata.AAC.5
MEASVKYSFVTKTKQQRRLEGGALQKPYEPPWRDDRACLPICCLVHARYHVSCKENCKESCKEIMSDTNQRQIWEHAGTSFARLSAGTSGTDPGSVIPS